MTINVSKDLRVEVQIAQNNCRLPIEDAYIWASSALENDQRTLCIRIVGEGESQELNSRFRKKKAPTNVLSFQSELVDCLGDIAICGPVVEREAVEQKKTLDDHYAHLIIHGILHLRGYDHIDDRDLEKMEGKEREILKGFGIADPYE